MSLGGRLTAEGRATICERLVAEVGGYLRNTVLEPQVTCGVCATPIRPDFDLCLRCHRDRRQFCQQLADLVVPVFYGIKGFQSAHLMRNYKDLIAPAVHNRTQLSVLLLATLELHGGCVESRLGDEIDAWAIVPSTRFDRIGEHPLRVVTKQTGMLLPEIELATRPSAHLDERVTSADRFTVAAGDVERRHVLLIEDTWTSGAKCQSAVLALRGAGASSVTILALARWLKPDEPPTGAFVRNRLTADYDPLVCPVNDTDCIRHRQNRPS